MAFQGFPLQKLVLNHLDEEESVLQTSTKINVTTLCVVSVSGSHLV